MGSGSVCRQNMNHVTMMHIAGVEICGVFYVEMLQGAFILYCLISALMHNFSV